VELATKEALKNDKKICICGSLSFSKEFRELFNR
jgi:folylpolyglutamate synthase/dihydropteroate synthase